MRDRSSYIGGSSASAIMCDNEYKTRRDVYEVLAGIRETDDLPNEGHIARGNTLEPIVEEWIGHNVDPTINGEKAFEEYDAGGGHNGQIFLQHPDHDYIGGHPDGIGFRCEHPQVPRGAGVIYEIKTPTTYNVKKIDKHGITGRYFWQVQHYMLITGIQHSLVVIWDYNQWKGRLYYVPAKPKLHEEMLEEYRDMYFCSQMGIMPEPKDDIQRQSQELPHKPELDRLLIEYEKYKGMKYEAKDKLGELKGQILSLVPDGQEIINTPNMRATIKYNWGRYDATYLKTSERDGQVVEDEYE